jgi:cyclase
VVPCLLLKGRGITKTVKFGEYTYIGDPVNAVRIFNEKEVDELMFLDIMASRDGVAPRTSYVRDIASECFMPLSYGGGIQSMGQIEALFRTGVEKVSLNSVVFSGSSVRLRPRRQPGIVVTVDVRKRFLGTTTSSPMEARSGSTSNSWIICDAWRTWVPGDHREPIDQDGLQSGYDLNLIGTAAKAVSTPVVALRRGPAPPPGGSRRRGVRGGCGQPIRLLRETSGGLITYPSRPGSARLRGWA